MVPLHAKLDLLAETRRWPPHHFVCAHVDPCSRATPRTWHASTTTDHHRNKHLDTPTTHGHDPDSTCQLARTSLFDSSSSLGQWSWWDSRHRTSVPPLPSTIILVHCLHDDNALSPLCIASPNGNRLPPRRRRHVHRLHPVAPPTNDRPPRGASTSRLPGASTTSNLWSRSDTNCWNLSTD
jgi:hypothetical protein